MLQQDQKKRAKSKPVRSARNRLMSIYHDVVHFCRPIIESPKLHMLPIIANERCGSWYAYPFMTCNSTTCCFKSTDGHYGSWNFSLKRLNLNVVRLLSSHQACILLDASTSKAIPDSFSRTLPIWAAVLCRIASRYRQDFGIPACSYDRWELQRLLFTPNSIVAADERQHILGLIDERVDLLYNTCAIVDPNWLASNLVKPIRPYWISPESAMVEEIPSIESGSDYYLVICLSCSDCGKSKKIVKEESLSLEPFVYYSGAADDHETWSRSLTAKLFWDNVQTLKKIQLSSADDFDKFVDSIAKMESGINGSSQNNDNGCAPDGVGFEQISNLNIYIGTRRSGRPPECWKHFDAILNVTDSEYEDIHESISNLGEDKFYLQLPVREGKRDRAELEHWLAVGVIFVVGHARNHRRVLIHCAQGVDRSVAVVMAVITIFCTMIFPLQWNSTFWHFPVSETFGNGDNKCKYLSSGLTCETVRDMQGRVGRDHLFNLLHPLNVDRSLNFTKASIRISLLLIQQDREKANPSRSTMQKLHRFFMSRY